MNKGSLGQSTRTRVPRACNRCRSKKDKCDGAQPFCSSCVSSGHKCTYVLQDKKRGLPEGYVRALEKMWAIAIRKIEGFEKALFDIVAGINDPLKDLSAGVALDAVRVCQVETQSLDQTDGNQGSSNIWRNQKTEELLNNVWKESPVLQELVKLISCSSANEQKATKRKRQRDDFDTQEVNTLLAPLAENHWEYSIIKRALGDQRQTTRSIESEGASPTPASCSTYHNLLKEHSATADEGLKSLGSAPDARSSFMILESLGISSVSSQILALYFSQTHCWLPIVERHEVLRTHHLHSKKPRHVSLIDQESDLNAVRLAIMAYSYHQLSSSGMAPPASSEVPGSPPISEQLYDVVRSLIPSESEPAKIGHVQALIILTLINIGKDRWSSAWLLIGQAVRLAVDLKLHRSSSPSSGDRRGRAKHIFLGCFLIDTMISAHLGRHPQLRTEDADAAGPLDEDGLEEWDLWTGNKQYPVRKHQIWTLYGSPWSCFRSQHFQSHDRALWNSQ